MEHCEKCHKRYSTTQSMLRHVREVHNEPEFVCGICCKRFRRSDAMTIHMAKRKCIPVRRYNSVEGHASPTPAFGPKQGSQGGGNLFDSTQKLNIAHRDLTPVSNSPTILDPTQLVETKSGPLGRHVTDLDRTIAGVLEQDLGESDKAMAYLMMLQKFFEYSTTCNEVRTMLDSITPIDVRSTQIMGPHPPTPVDIEGEEDVSVAIEPIWFKSTGRVNRSGIRRSGQKISSSPILTSRWIKYK